MKNTNVKRIKTVNSFKKKSLVLDSLHQSNTESESILNITINNNIQKTNQHPKNRNKPRYRRHKTEFFANHEKGLSDIMNRLISQKISNVNININIHEHQKKDSHSAEKKKPVMLWKKTLNVQRMVNAFLHPSVVKIDDNEIFNDTLKNTLLGSDSKSILNKTTTDQTDCKEITLGQFLQKSEVEREFIRVSLKEKAFKIITEGSIKNSNIINELEKLFNQNPEKFKYSTYDKKYLFNQFLSNGKTLLYIACQEGAKEVVEFLLKKNLNPNIRVNYFDMEDTCLWVSCRWGYYDIVKMLLETTLIYPNDIEKALNQESGNNKKISILLYNHLPDDLKKSKRGCACF